MEAFKGGRLGRAGIGGSDVAPVNKRWFDHKLYFGMFKCKLLIDFIHDRYNGETAYHLTVTFSFTFCDKLDKIEIN